MPEKKFDDNNVKDKLYVLSMFPYPSGFLHMGHVRVYGTSDILARYHRMRGKNVLHPMGWDAFGLPAENAALERKTNAEDWTQKNIANMKSVMEELNFSFDWDREFATCDSEYYRWTQFFFIKLFESGLAYQKEAFVNWDPVDKTVLADEQVDENGCSWRSGAVVEKKLLKQWFIRTTAFAKSLLEGLEDPILQGWKDIIDIQKHWIGEVNGTNIDFEIMEGDDSKGKKMSVWMKNPEFIDKAKFVAVKRGSFWTFGCDEDLLPFKVKNPFTSEVLPVYQTDSLPFEEKAEVYLGIPELNEEDKTFADSVGVKYSLEKRNLARKEELLALRQAICAEARQRRIGGWPTSAGLRDWLISRQRYWGTPIPIIHCKKCGAQTVPEEDLPVKLPPILSVPKEGNPLEKETDWLNTTCPKCGGPAVRETDTMDTFVDSSWYYLRFIDPDNQGGAFDIEKVKTMMPVDIYVGGKEHAVLHLFYARFMNHFLESLGVVPHREPFGKFISQGVVRGLTYKTVSTGKYLNKDLVEKKNGKLYETKTNELVVEFWEKMSKSKHNSVEPMDLISRYGVDATRLLSLSASSPKSELNWNENLYDEIFKWQRRLWLTVSDFIKLRSSKSGKPEETKEYKDLDFYIFDSRNFYLKQVTTIIEESCAVGIALKKMQGLTGSLRKSTKDIIIHSLQYERALAVQIILLAPFAPYFASELWTGFLKAPNRLSNPGEFLWDRTVLEQPWPQLDPEYKQMESESVSEFEGNPILDKIQKAKEMERLKKLQKKQKKKLKGCS